MNKKCVICGGETKERLCRECKRLVNERMREIMRSYPHRFRLRRGIF